MAKPIITTKAALLAAVRTAARASGRSVRDLAKETGVSKSHVQRVNEDRDASVSLESLMTLADLFGLAYRFEGKPTRAKKTG